MKTLTVIMTALLLTLTANNALAGYSADFTIGELPMKFVGDTFILVADVDKDGFSDFTDPTSFANDDDDAVIFSGEMIDLVVVGFPPNTGAGFLTELSPIVDPDNLLPADAGTQEIPVKAVWYDLPFADFVLGDGPGPNVMFGTFMDESFIAGNSGDSAAQYVALGQAFGLDADLTSGDGVTTPEPTTAMLAILGAGALAMRRRRSA